MKRRARALPFIMAALVAAAVGVGLLLTDALRGPEHTTVDVRFDLRGEHEPRSDIVIVAIDDKTLKADGNFPFNRRRHARVIRELTTAGAGAIAYLVQFTQPSPDTGADNALISAVRAGAPRVILAATAVDPGGKTAIFGGDEGLAFSRAIPGFSSFRNDEDGVLRRMPDATENGIESVTYAAARVLGRPLRQPAGERAWVDFPGPAGAFKQLSFSDVERGNFPAEALRGKVVVVGATAPALRDRRRTPTSEAYPGAELHSASIATALDGFPLRDGPGWIDVLLVVVLGAVAPLVALRFGALVGVGAGALATVLFLVGAQLAFNAGTVLTVMPALAAAATGVLATLLVSVPVGHPRVNRVLDRLSPGAGMNRRTRRLRTSLLLGAAVLCAGGSLGLMALHALQRLDLTTVDMRFDVRGAREPADSVVVVAIDDPTVNTADHVFPFDRRYHAKVIRNLAEAGAAAIAYDVQFTTPSTRPKADNALIETVRAAAPRVVLATTAVDPGGKTAIFGGGEALKYSRGIPAFSAFQKDPDGITRHMLDGDEGLPSLPIAAAQVKLGRRVTNVPPGNSAWIDFAGPPGTVPYISFIDVERGRFRASDVKGKIVVVGASATVLQDIRETSTTGQQAMPGPEVHAHAITTVLAGFPLTSGAGWINALLVVVLGVAAPFAALRLRMVYAFAIGVVAIALLLVAAQLTFGGGVIISIVYALVAGLAALLATAAIHGVTVAFERATTRDAFARFVPESVVDQVLQDADGLRLGGVRGEATVMFSDLRGFTSFAETLEPEQVIAALNLYLTAMSEAILDHGGTLVAYMGDGIMAVFGAPLQQEDHADRALAAARDMLDRLEGFNDALRQDSLHKGFKMGIGLNTGAVMSGNVGSERRLEYTALGDTTNTAARLEGMTKGTPYQLYVSDSTRAALKQPADDLVEVGEFEVRGRKAKIKLWSLGADKPAEPAPAADSPPAPPATAQPEPEGYSPAPAESPA
jgi:adenylate cyclase